MKSSTSCVPSCSRSAATVWWVLAGIAVAVELSTGTFYMLMLALGLAAGAIASHLGFEPSAGLDHRRNVLARQFGHRVAGELGRHALADDKPNVKASSNKRGRLFASTPTHSLPSVIRPRGMAERMIFCFVSTVNNLKREARLERHVASYTGIVYFQLHQHPNFGRDGNRRRSPQVANGCWVPLNDFRRRPNCVTHTSHESRVTKDHPHMLRTHRTYSA